MPPRLLVEARPGAGKTTAFRRLAELLRESGTPVTGFTTEEVRERGRRVGFSVESLDGKREMLAHVELPGPPSPGDVVLIDELGKMELASEKFRAAIEQIFDGPAALAATLQVARHPFTDGLRRRPGVEVIRLTAANRNALPAELARQLRRCTLYG